MTILAAALNSYLGKPANIISKLNRFQLFIVFLISIYLALMGLGTPGIGFDEAATWWAARLDWQELGRLLGNQDRNFGIYYAVMHIWMKISDSLWWLRLPSAIGGALSVTATVGLARNMYGPRVGWISGLLMVTAYSWVRFSQEVRPYSWSLALATCATWLFLALAGRCSNRLRAAYILIMVLLPLSHLFAGMVAGVHFLYAVFAKERKLAFLAIIGALPSALVAALVAGQVAQVSWLHVMTPIEALRELVGQSKAVWYIPVALIAAVELIGYRRLGLAREKPSAEVTLFVSWWAAPPLLLWTASIVATPVYSARYTFWTIPAMIVPAAHLISRLGDFVRARFSLILVGALFTAVTLPGQFSARAPNGHVWAPQVFAAVVVDQGKPTDALVDPGFLALTLKYHLRNHILPEPLVAQTAEATGMFVDLQEPVEEQSEKLKNYDRLWILDEIAYERPLPHGFCRKEFWDSDFGIARLTLAIKCY